GSWLLSRLAVARWATTKWPAFRRRHRRPGFPRRRRPPPFWTSRSCRSRQDTPGRWTSKPSRCGRMAADTSLSFRGGRNRQPRWLRAEVGEACALERSDAPISIGAQARGEGAVRELRSAEKRRGLHPREHASALFRELDGTAAVGERAGQITPQAPHLAQDCVRSVEGLERALALLGEECLQGGLSLGRAPEVCARQRPPDAAQARCGGPPDRLP